MFIDPSLRFNKVQGDERMRIIARHERMPTAFPAMSDIMALGAVRALKDAGVRIPRDVSLVGLDDINLAQFANPPLTTVRQEKFAMGQAAAQLLVENLSARVKAAPRKITLPTTLVIRDSVAPPRR